MKIYLYLKHFPPYGENLMGGTSKSVHGFAAGMASCGADVTILCEGKSNSLCQTTFNYKIECFANLKNYRTFSISPDLQKYISEKIRPDDLVILNGIFHLSVYSMSRLLKKRSLAYVVMPHGVYAPAMLNKNPYLKWPYWFLFERPMLMDAKAIQLLDRRQADWLKKLGINKLSIETPNGFFKEEVPLSSSFTWKKSKIPKLFFFGRIDIYIKGLDLLLEAFHKVNKQISTELTIQGPNCKDKEKLQEMSRQLLLEGGISFLDPDFDTHPTAIMAEYDVFCLPSRSEGFGLSALEAMLAGRVLLVSEAAGIAPHVEASDCGVVVAPESSAIETGLLEILERRSEWRDMGLRGQQYALENLSWEKIADSALRQYQQLMA
jgi:glycosyltransferase involved in cell wall biosynthesis